MKTRFWLLIFLVLTGVLALMNCGAAVPGSQALEFKVLGQKELFSGAFASLRVITYDSVSNEPLSQIPVKISILPQKSQDRRQLYQGLSNAHGTLDARFQIPSYLEGKATLIVSVGEEEQPQEMESAITVKKGLRLYLTTDKPLYQPGQVIHIRTLGLLIPSLIPPGGSKATLEVEDPKGNKIFRKSGTASKFGIYSAEFQLADELNLGEYRVRAIMAGEEQERTILVKRYVLPKFAVTLKTQKPYYLPGETIRGRVKAEYFFGKPVAGSRVNVELSTFDTRFEKVGSASGKTTGEGFYSFELKLPSYLVGQPLEKGRAQVWLEARVTDEAEHAEKKKIAVPVAQEAIKIDVIPESGKLKAGIENRIYCVTSYPDGSPASTRIDVQVDDKKSRIFTDSSGFAEFSITPGSSSAPSIRLEAADDKGNKSLLNPDLSLDKNNDALILRLNRPVLKAGETLSGEVISGDGRGTVYLDILQDGQTVVTRSLTLSNGRGNFSLNITADLRGTLTLHAYRILKTEDIVRDSKLLLILPGNDLKVEIRPHRKVYIPGSAAKVNFQVSDAKGYPAPAAIGLDIVDEAVFALGEAQSGLPRVYFLLEKELLEPKYEIHGMGAMDLILKKPVKDSVEENLARVIFSRVPEGEPFSINMDSQRMKLEKVAGDFEIISDALNRYYEKKHAYPGSGRQSELISGGYIKKDNLVDPWGNPYEIQVAGGFPRILCKGPDGLAGTYDDIDQKTIYKLVRRLNIPEDILMARDVMVLNGLAGARKGTMASGKPPSTASSSRTAVRIREDFPETLYTNPQILTNDNGFATQEIQVGDSITTFRISAFANSLRGEMGQAAEPLRVFQDFFIDLDLPAALTRNDEIALPVALYNYLKTPQRVELELDTSSAWFTLMDRTYKAVTLAPNEVRVIYFRIKVTEPGWHKVTVKAQGGQMSDAVRREIEVLPDGKEFVLSQSGRLQKSSKVMLNIPKDAIPGASKILVTIYPGIFSQVMDGMDKIFQMPYGCFEQTSSTTYPNVLVLDYLQRAGKVAPDIRMKAEGFINAGYQRLLSYEVSGGGFSWFGQAPANKILTAFGVMEFKDMSAVYDIDTGVIGRTQRWLLNQQEQDGSWAPDAQYLHADSWAAIQDNHLPVTAYIAWSLLESGCRDAKVEKALRYIREHLARADAPYILALCANALVADDPQSRASLEALNRLVSLSKEEKGSTWWESSIKTATFSHGVVAGIETSALALIALMKAGGYESLSRQVIAWLVKVKDPRGTWHSTQATILAMKALVLSQEKAARAANGKVAIQVNGRGEETCSITPEDYDIFRLFDFGSETKNGENTVELNYNGSGDCYYQAVARYYIPWNQVADGARDETLRVGVSYDRATLSQNDFLTCRVQVKNLVKKPLQMIIVDLGVPPGFEVQTADLEELVTLKRIKKYTLSARQIIAYLEGMSPLESLDFSYRLRAKFPIRAKSPQSRVYEYYNPETGSTAPPALLEIK
ncbi:MAG: MG2 domain-containing protein [bacterium]